MAATSKEGSFSRDGKTSGEVCGEHAGETDSRVYQNPILVGVVLLVAGISVAMIQYKVPTIMTDLMAAFSMSAQAASWLMSVFTLMSIFVALPAGMLAQRFGAKNMMIVACGIAVAGSLIGVCAGTSAVLIASRAVEGVALTVLTTCGPIVVQMCVKPENIGTSMGVWGIWGCLGSTIAAVVTPTVFENLGFDGLWIAFAVVAALAAVLVLVAIRMPEGAEGEATQASAVPATEAVEAAEFAEAAPIVESALSALAAEAASGPTSAAAVVAPAAPSVSAPAAPTPADPPRYREIFTKDIALFFVGFIAFNICLLAILSYVPTILQMQGFDPTLSGFISTAPMLLSIVSSPLFGVVSDRIGRCKPLLVAAMLVMGPCTFLLYTQTGALLWVAVVVMGLVGMGGVGMFLSGYTKLLARPELASIGMGVMVLMQGVGQFLGSFLVQMLLGPDLTSWMFAGVVLMALGLVGTLALLMCKMR